MNIYSDSIQNLSATDRLRLVEQIWDGLSQETNIPLPVWAIDEAKRRRDEMTADPELGMSHEEVWRKINDHRNG